MRALVAALLLLAVPHAAAAEAPFDVSGPDRVDIVAGNVTEATFVVRNAGAAPLGVAFATDVPPPDFEEGMQVEMRGPPPFTFKTTPANATLAPNATLAVVVHIASHLPDFASDIPVRFRVSAGETRADHSFMLHVQCAEGRSCQQGTVVRGGPGGEGSRGERVTRPLDGSGGGAAGPVTPRDDPDSPLRESPTSLVAVLGVAVVATLARRRSA